MYNLNPANYAGLRRAMVTRLAYLLRVDGLDDDKTQEETVDRLISELNTKGVAASPALANHIVDSSDAITLYDDHEDEILDLLEDLEGGPVRLPVWKIKVDRCWLAWELIAGSAEDWLLCEDSVEDLQRVLRRLAAVVWPADGSEAGADELGEVCNILADEGFGPGSDQ